MNKTVGLVYVGKITCIEEIPGADVIASATVVCGEGGKWKGIIRKYEFRDTDNLCYVFLPDSLLPETEDFDFMRSSNFRVKMRMFKGASSEVLILPFPIERSDFHTVGKDVTDFFGVTKYSKPIPESLQGKAVGDFPSFIPKTDEPNYQNSQGQEGIEKLIGHSYYITEKADGSSATAYKYKGHFGVCSRNWEIKKDIGNGYWKVAIKSRLEELLPEGYALQWETVGPKIQNNPMRIREITGLAFSAYNIEKKCYLTFLELVAFCRNLQFPMVPIVSSGQSFSAEGIETLGEGIYKSGQKREGVVVRSCENIMGGEPVSFKVINLNYER
jgi:RNA ligase (TIGR02306 family)